MKEWQRNIARQGAEKIAGKYGGDMYDALNKHFGDDTEYETGEELTQRFEQHKIAKTKDVEIFILMFAFGFVVSMFNDILGNLVLIASMFFAGFSLIRFFRGRTEKQRFCDYENKLINLMIQTPKIPERFNDKNVSVECSEIDDSGQYVVFALSVRDVVGGLEFIENNVDKWAASFGDRDGADFRIISTGYYQIRFDTLGKQSEKAAVEW